MRTEKKYFFTLNLRSAFLYILSSLVLASCTKSGTTIKVDNNRITYVLLDNFNLSIFNTALKRSGGDILLKQDGPFTVLAPTNAAANSSILTGDVTTVTRYSYYHILDGALDINKLPLKFNQDVSSRGNKFLVTRWIKGVDTVVTFNGVRVISKNVKASNGLINVLAKVLIPYNYSTLGDALADDQTMTLFYQAVVSAGMLPTINGTSNYTIFAPNNAAMINAGYTTLDQISKTAPAVLQRLVKAHIATDRHFVYDYILIADATNITSQTMLDGTVNTITLKQNSTVAGGYSGIWIRGNLNGGNIEIDKSDIIAGNGILHSIQETLKN
ncbi:fasciclin domain-containing protein [Mucilaginibacter paludis]|uniref:Beta-Ig-H3/fasciclin n=1 Tax=Mucilaginibacter paludis DSM 18603 TaxID=714943 RepID=H1YC17_9SPHI|nr:fasciclin domain-containing protein [Mucilaginibacter paludis]EHQ29580.1 beta-Ig-H3/fasciclin [Mucilaginibacter paludis DSM 18603]